MFTSLKKLAVIYSLVFVVAVAASVVPVSPLFALPSAEASEISAKADEFVGPLPKMGPVKPSPEEDADADSTKGKNGKKETAKDSKEHKDKGKDAEAESKASPQDDEETTREDGDDSSWPSFWPKHALWDYYAHDDGSMNEWAEGWFVAHHWSEAGAAISGLYEGDVIIIDGVPITIVNREYRSVDETYESIRGDVGAWGVIFQTCLGDGATNIILTGTADGMGPYDVPDRDQSFDFEDTTYEEHVTWVNEYGEFDTYEEAVAAAEWHYQQEYQQWLDEQEQQEESYVSDVIDETEEFVEEFAGYDESAEI